MVRFYYSDGGVSIFPLGEVNSHKQAQRIARDLTYGHGKRVAALYRDSEGGWELVELWREGTRIYPATFEMLKNAIAQLQEKWSHAEV